MRLLFPIGSLVFSLQSEISYQNDAASNAGSNNHASPSASSMVTNTASRSRWVDHANTSAGWGSGNQSASSAAANNHWIDSVRAPE
eukprot:scaffold86597_cov60-Attheya_sp.AAC.2